MSANQQQSARLPRIALVTTVKNERDLLRLNLQYHHFLGVEQFYVFTDKPTDDTVETISELSYVWVGESVLDGRYDHEQHDHQHNRAGQDSYRLDSDRRG